MKKIKFIPMCNKLILIVLFLLNVNILYSQTKNSINSGFRISLSEGVTYNFDKNIYGEGKTLAPVASSFNLDITNFDIGYFISNHNEFGISIGKNSFTSPENFITSAQILKNDTTYLYSSGYKYVNLTWFALYYNYHFNNTFKLGLKLGELRPDDRDYKIYLSLSVGKYYKITDNFLIDITFSFTNRNKAFKYFESNQLKLTLGLNLNI